MVAFNFKARFADDVENYIKRQTIRQKARCKTGDDLQLYTGMRTKSCRKLRDAVCTSVIPIAIYATHMTLDGVCVPAGTSPCECCEDHDNDFAHSDGFDGYSEMTDFFREEYGALPFHGFLITWR